MFNRHPTLASCALFALFSALFLYICLPFSLSFPFMVLVLSGNCFRLGHRFEFDHPMGGFSLTHTYLLYFSGSWLIVVCTCRSFSIKAFSGLISRIYHSQSTLHRTSGSENGLMDCSQWPSCIHLIFQCSKVFPVIVWDFQFISHNRWKLTRITKLFSYPVNSKTICPSVFMITIIHLTNMTTNSSLAISSSIK